MKKLTNYDFLALCDIYYKKTKLRGVLMTVQSNSHLSLSITIIFLLASCTTINLDAGREFSEYMNSMLGVMTYDQALITFGEPTSTFQGDEIFVVTWGAENLSGAVFPVGKAWIAMPMKEGWKLQLSFNKDTRKLAGWKYDQW